MFQKSKHKIYLQSLASSFGVLAYVLLVAYVLSHAEKWFGASKSMVGPAAFLLLFVLSAAVVGSLLVGQPFLMYLDGKKKEAIRLFFLSLLWLLFFVLIFLISLAVRAKI